MGEIRSYRDLVAWQKSTELAVFVYDLTKPMPDHERYGLTSQVRRAAVSVPSNIAEGYGRGTTADYVRFLRSARGSLYEVDTQLLIAAKLEYLAAAAYAEAVERLNECGRVLAALIRSLEAHSQS